MRRQVIEAHEEDEEDEEADEFAPLLAAGRFSFNVKGRAVKRKQERMVKGKEMGDPLSVTTKAEAPAKAAPAAAPAAADEAAASAASAAAAAAASIRSQGARRDSKELGRRDSINSAASQDGLFNLGNAAKNARREENANDAEFDDLFGL